MANEHYEAFPFRLADGTHVRFTPLTPADRERIRRGFALISEESRFLRFFASLDDLTDRQLEYLTDVDQEAHVAWGVIDLEHPDQPGLGVGRFIRETTCTDVAEVAITVVDAYQHQGVGSALFALLYLRALDLGVHTLRAYILPQNQFIADQLRRIGGTVRWEDDMMQIDLPVYDDWSKLESTDAGDTFVSLLRRLDAARREAP